MNPTVACHASWMIRPRRKSVEMYNGHTCDEYSEYLQVFDKNSPTYLYRIEKAYKWVAHTQSEANNQQRVTASFLLNRNIPIFHRMLFSDEIWDFYETPYRVGHWV